ncbi:MAG: hypothetical protein KGZ63_02290 [Clostridiales bacterium]|jgi:hypothetical protein|nr:hypothetical protein [Clostridiales bacterium]
MKENALPTSAQEFLQTLFPGFDSNKQLIEIRPLDMDGRPRSRMFFTTIKDAAQYAIRKEADKSLNVYFQCATLKPESEHDNKATKEYCHSYNFLYADLDPKIKCPTTKEVIRTYTKDELMQKIKNFPLPASIIVDSGNGYHAYWLLDKALRDQVLLKKILIKYQSLLQSDGKATLATQILRVVGTTNKKPLKEGKPALQVRVVGGNGRRYSLGEVMKVIGHMEISPVELKPQNIGASTDSRAKGVTTETVSFFQTHPKHDFGREPENFFEVRDILKRQNPLVASNMPKLGLGKTFRCLFHDDNTPSANIYQHKDGYFYYKCFGCDIHIDIIGLYQKIFKTDFVKAIEELCNFYGIKNIKSEWYYEQLEKFHRNAVFIEEFEQLHFDVLYPNAYKLLRPRLKHLAELNQFALAKMCKGYQEDGDSLFYIGYDRFASKYKFSKSSVRNYINLYAVLGLVRKWDVGDIDLNLQKKAMEYSQKMKKEKGLLHVEPVNFYTLPCFFERMQLAESRAKALMGASFKLRTCMNKAFLILALGKGIANEVYPDAREVSRLSYDTAESLNKALLRLIAKQGYATKAQVISKTKITGVSSQRKKREWDRHQNIILARNGFMEKWANKALKEELGLRKYCPVIIPQSTAQKFD